MIIQSILQIDSFTSGFCFSFFLQGSETFAHTTLFFPFFFLAGQLKTQIQINAHILFFCRIPSLFRLKLPVKTESAGADD